MHGHISLVWVFIAVLCAYKCTESIVLIIPFPLIAMSEKPAIVNVVPNVAPNVGQQYRDQCKSLSY